MTAAAPDADEFDRAIATLEALAEDASNAGRRAIREQIALLEDLRRMTDE